MHLIDFFKNELNYKCEICTTAKFEKQKSCPEFKYCFNCTKVICPNCYKKHKKEHKYIVPIYEMHLKNLHSPQKLLSDNIVSNQLETVPDVSQNNNENYNNINNNMNEKNMYDYKPTENDIQTIKNKNKELKNRIKSLRVMIKMNKILLKTYKKHPENYFNNKNISNVANSIINNGGIISNIDERESDIRIQKIEKMLLNIVNNKLGINLNGNETNIDLSNKSIGDTEFKLITSITFKNLEQLNLQNNNINVIDSLSIFNAPKLKKIDLSSNQISNIYCLRNASERLPLLETLLLNFNKIDNIDILDEAIFPQLKEINLDNNYFDSNSSKNKNILSKYNKASSNAQDMQYDLR